MGRQFSGTSQYLQSSATIDLSSFSKLNIMIWYWWDAYGTDDDLLLEFGTGVSDGGFTFDWNDSGVGPSGNVGLYTYNAGQTDMNAADFPRPSAAGWHQLVVYIDRAQGSPSINAFRNIFSDSVDVAFNTPTDNTLDPLNFGNLTLTVFARSDGSLAGAGRAAEVALWGGITMVQADVNALWNGGAGIDASTVQSGSLVYYNQICGSSSPEPPKVGAANLTVTGATSTGHPISGSGICGAVTLLGGMSM